MTNVNKDMLITMYKHMLSEGDVKYISFTDIKSGYQDASVIHPTLEIIISGQDRQCYIYLTSASNFGLNSKADVLDAIKFPISKDEFDELFIPTDIKYQEIKKEQDRILQEKLDAFKEKESHQRDEYIFDIYDKIINNKISNIIKKD